MYFDDHGPPHFHVRAAGHGAKVRIDTLEVLVSDLSRRELRFVLAWAEMHAARASRELAPSAGRCHTARNRAAEMIGLTPDITQVSVPRHGALRLTFADGVAGDVYVLDRMRGPVFEYAVTPEGFAEVSVDAESGTICWPGGADLAPDTLYERVRTGIWPGQSQAA